MKNVGGFHAQRSWRISCTKEVMRGKAREVVLDLILKTLNARVLSLIMRPGEGGGGH